MNTVISVLPGPWIRHDARRDPPFRGWEGRRRTPCHHDDPADHSLRVWEDLTKAWCVGAPIGSSHTGDGKNDSSATILNSIARSSLMGRERPQAGERVARQGLRLSPRVLPPDKPACSPFLSCMSMEPHGHPLEKAAPGRFPHPRGCSTVWFASTAAKPCQVPLPLRCPFPYKESAQGPCPYRTAWIEKTSRDGARPRERLRL